MSAHAEQNAAQRALERAVHTLTLRVEKLEALAERNTDDATSALANTTGALSRLTHLESLTTGG